MTAGGGVRARRPLIAGNWKMYKTAREGGEFVVALAAELNGYDGADVVVAPSFVGLQQAVDAARDTAIQVAAQDIYWEIEGAYTGEVSPVMLADVGVTSVIIGHSERRQHFGETDTWVARKVRAALDHGLQPIMCLGETQEERESGRMAEVLSTQVPAGLDLVEAGESERMAIAYEPIWAIGTGKTATPAMAQEAIAFIRDQLMAMFGEGAAQAVRVLYGGSVKPDNIDELMAQPDIDGVLVGGASLDVASFARIVRFRNV